jgi:hypothetical protein
MMMQQAGIESKASTQKRVDALIEMVEAGVRSGEAACSVPGNFREFIPTYLRRDSNGCSALVEGHRGPQ